MSVARASAPSSWARTFRPSFSVLTPLLSLFLPPFRSASSLPSSSVSSALLDFLSSSISLWIDPSLPRAFYTLLSNRSKLVSDHRARSTLLPSFMEMAITLLILVEHFLRNGEGRRGDRWGPRWKMEISISKKFNFAEFIDFFPQILRDFSSDSVVNLEKFSFSPIELFSKGTEFVERVQFVSLFSTLSFSLSSYSTPLHTSFYSPFPPGSLRKARDQEQGHCLGDDKHPCFGVSVSFHARSLGGRHFGRCLFNQVWRTTRSLGRLNLPPPHLLSSPQVTW